MKDEVLVILFALFIGAAIYELTIHQSAKIGTTRTDVGKRIADILKN